MTTKYRIKRDDTVKVIAGKNKGQIGRVLRVIKTEDPAKTRVVVEGVQKVRRHQRPVADRPGGIIEKEASIHISNVVLWNAAENKAVKVALRKGEDGKTIRVDRKTGAAIEKA